ncbi:hypothetical protein AGMMS4952_14360 [Spirochaetia bacterium]|nr:hypothetical protein AGMMS4952_14360 [Spirochaetia bacterium]
MIKKFVSVICALAAALVIFAACENPAVTPSGIYGPKGGIPGGGSLGGSNYGVPDPGYSGFRFDASSFETMPSVAVWNSLGHQHAFPDLFHFANGNKVVTKADWEARQAEISRILQYYEYGIMPPLKEEEGVHITFENEGSANTSFTVTYQGRSFAFDISTTLPGTQTSADRGHLGLYFNSSGEKNWSGGTGTFTSNGLFAQEIDASGAVPTLFGLDISDPNSASANMSYAWGMSVVLTAMEGIDLNGDGEIDPETEQAFRGWYDPKKVGLQGYSRTGKAAMVMAAFAKGRNGSQIGHVAIGSAGSGGPALERFISPSGYRVNGLPADPLPIGQPGIMDYSLLKGKSWYLKKMENGESTLGGGPIVTPSAGIDDNYRYRTVRGWSPYFESYERTPIIIAVGGASYEDTTPFVGWQAPSTYYPGNQGYWGGIQNLSESRNECPGWFSVRFREFQDLHYGLDMDHVTGNEFRPPYGLLCTIPFDQHYLAALIAPRGILFQDGLGVPRNNPDSQFATWIINDEVYKFLGEMEGNEYKYIWRSGVMFTLGQHTLATGNEAPDRNYHATLVFKDYDAKAGIAGGEELPSGTSAPGDYHLFKLRDPIYHIDDPLGRFDYYRVNWGRPGHPSVADRVRSRLPDALIAAYEADEIHRPAPWTYGNTSHTVDVPKVLIPNPPVNGDGTNVPASVTVDYTGWKTTAAAPSIPRFKPMDWRGLIDTPEDL